jgi:DNA-binding transcriptional LysR family regulator
MKIDALKYAIEIGRVGSISRAAEKFYINQPTISKMIHDLEKTLNFVIFKRTHSGMVPTKKGEEFLIYAKSILSQIGMIENLGRSNASQKITFNIVVPRASYIAYAFTELIRTFPVDTVITVDYREANSLSAIRDVADGENDLGVIRFPVEYEKYFIGFLQEKDLNFKPILHFEYLVLFSKAHPLAKETPLTLSRLEACTEIVHGDTNIPSFLNAKKISDVNKRQIAVYERASQLELLSRIPGTYMWVSPMPENVLSTYGLIQCRCDNKQDFQKDFVIYRNSHKFTDEETNFISQLRKVVKEISLP